MVSQDDVGGWLLALLAAALVGLVFRLVAQGRALRASEARFKRERQQMRILINTLPDLVWLKDENGVYLACNHRFERFFGAAEAQIVGRTDHDFVEPALADFFRANDRAAMRAERATVNEESIVFADGHPEVLETTKTPMRGADGQLIGVLGIGHDITRRKEAERQLRLSQQALETEKRLLQTILDHAPWGLWLVDVHGRVLFVNKTFCAATGVSESRFMQAEHYADVLPPRVADNCRASDAACLAQGGAAHQSMEWLPFTDGREHLLEITKVCVHEADGSVKGVLGLAADATERRRAQAQLQLAASVFTHAREGILITDAQGAIVDANEAFTRITGYRREEALGHNPWTLKSTRLGESGESTLPQELAAKGHWQGEMWSRRKDGEVFAEMITISAVHDTDGRVQHYVSLFTDITPLKNYQLQLERLVHYDVLTGLPNRVLLADRLRQAMAQAARRKQMVAVVYLDLDGFKAVNDRCGHDVGDQLLVALARRMKEALREGDTLARIGGDEFVAVLVDLDSPDGCGPVVERLLQSAAAPLLIGGSAVQVSASMGVTFYPEDPVEAEALMRHADHAMYQAKQAGKNRCQRFQPGPLARS